MKKDSDLKHELNLLGSPITVQDQLIEAIDAFAGGIALYDHQGCLIVANKCYESFFPEISDMQIGDRLEDQLRQRMAVNGIPDAIGCEEQWLLERMSDFYEPALTTREVLQPDGRWIQANEHSVDNGILRTLVDITVNKGLSLQLLESEQRFKDFASCVADVFWETDAQLNYSYLDGQVQALLGQPADVLIGRPMILLSPDVTVSYSSADTDPQRQPWHKQAEFSQTNINLVLPDSSRRTLSKTGKPIFTKMGEFKGYRGTLIDITELRRTETQSLELQDELAHMGRLTTMGQMATGLAHELNQPLLAISQSTDTAIFAARENPVDDTELVECLEDIQSQTQRAGEIIRALRQFMSKDTAKRAPLDLNALIKQTIPLINPDARKHRVALKVQLSEISEPNADRVQIAQVLVNLLRNGVEAIAGTNSLERQVTVETHCRGDDEILVAVVDTGPGPAMGVEPFKAFESNKTDGMGMGLSISRSIIESHGGKLWLDDTTGTRTRFSFTLPTDK